MTQDTAGPRERIIAAAVAMLGEDATTSLSVRAVAARAGVSTGSLRHFFPTQRALRDTVLANLYTWVVPDDRIHDSSARPRDRLVDCLRNVLAPAAPGAQAREAAGTLFHSFIAPEPTDEIRTAYLAMDREGQRRVESWLAVLTREGALPDGDNTRRARFLMTVLNGLATERALPADDSILQSETETLYMAVDCVLGNRT